MARCLFFTGIAIVALSSFRFVIRRPFSCGITKIGSLSIAKLSGMINIFGVKHKQPPCTSIVTKALGQLRFG